MGLINFGAGLAAAGQSIANTAGAMALEEQRSQLDAQKIQLAESLRRGSQDREFAHADAATDKEIKARKDAADSAARISGDELQSVVPDDKGELTGITKAGGKKPLGLISSKPSDPVKDKFQGEDGEWYLGTESGKTIDTGKKGRLPPDSIEPVVEVADPSSPTGTKFVTRSDAVGKPGKPDKPDKLSISDVIAPILQKMADGTELTPSENKAWDAYTKLDPVKQLIAKALGGAGDPLTDQPGTGGVAPAPKPAPTKPVAARPPKPTGEYSDAQWSDRAGAWVVKRNGTWNAIEQK